MTETPLISVVIPAFNAADTIRETVESALNQTYQNLEILIVDDGSTDATGNIITWLAGTDSRIKLIKQQHSGVAAARNAGWQTAKADFIAFLDADDLWAPTKIELQFLVLHDAEKPSDIVYCGYTRIDQAGYITETWPITVHSGIILDALLTDNFIGANGSSILARRVVLQTIGGFDHCFRDNGAEGCDDYLFCCLAAENFRFDVVSKTLVGYRNRPGSLSSNPILVLKSRLLATCILKNHYPGKQQLIDAGAYKFIARLIKKSIFQRQLFISVILIVKIFRKRPEMGVKIVFVYLPIIILKITHRLARKLSSKLLLSPVTTTSRINFLNK